LEHKIRVATVADLLMVHRIEVGSYPDPWPRSIFFLMRGRAPDLFLVAEAEDTIVGYTIGEVKWRSGSKVGHVMNVAISETWRRRGLALRLLDELESRFRLRGAKSAYLEVRASNTSALKLYRKRGYIEIDSLPGYYREEDGLAMEKPLT
jgi:ribosomal-protein-alanine N-acetyltransferase